MLGCSEGASIERLRGMARLRELAASWLEQR
jgi:hypothetical protein